MPLIRVDAGGAPVAAEEQFIDLADDATLPQAGGAIVSLARFQAERERLLARNAPLGVRLKASESPEALGDDVHRLSLVAIEFPVFRDGRGFSWARLLRTRMGYKGEVRAVGHYLYDQLAYQHRVGFDAWDVPPSLGVAQFARAFGEITNVYQPSADGRRTIRELRGPRNSGG